MSNLSQIKTDSNWGLEAPRINQNFANLNTEIDKVKSGTISNKGYFGSLALLQDAYPPEKSKVGMIAYVGTKAPYTIYEYKSTGWTSTGETYTPEVDLGDYYTKQEVDATQSSNEQKFQDLELKIEEGGGGGITINGDVTNNADDEDIESAINEETQQGVLKFKDRSYLPSNFSGKGYKILRKNIVDGSNVLTPNMISNNTQHEVRYDFDLLNNTLQVDSFGLKFNGGIIRNGTIVSNNIEIPNYINSQIFENITFQRIDDKKISPLGGVVNVKWFGAKGDGSTDDSQAILNALNVCTMFAGSIACSILYFPAGIYNIEQDSIFSSMSNSSITAVRVIGDGYSRTQIKLITNGEEKWLYNNVSTSNRKTADFTFENLSITTDDNLYGNVIKQFSGGSEKRFKFLNCNITANNILWCEGTGNADLSIFDNCGIYCYGHFLYTNNPQSVTHRITNSTIIVYNKSLVRQKQGGNFYFANCEIEIIQETTHENYIYLVEAYGGAIGASEVAFTDCRFELHGKGRIVKYERSPYGFTTRFIGCTINTPNNTEDYYTIITYSKCVIFDMCILTSKIKFGIGDDGYASASSVSAPLLIIRNCDLGRKTLEEQFNCVGECYRVIVDKCYANLMGQYGLTRAFLDIDLGYDTIKTIGFPSTVKRICLPTKEAGYISTNAWQEASIPAPIGCNIQNIHFGKGKTTGGGDRTIVFEIYGEDAEGTRVLLASTNDLLVEGENYPADNSVSLNTESLGINIYKKFIIKRVTSHALPLGNLNFYIDYI